MKAFEKDLVNMHHSFIRGDYERIKKHLESLGLHERAINLIEYDVKSLGERCVEFGKLKMSEWKLPKNEVEELKAMQKKCERMDSSRKKYKKKYESSLRAIKKKEGTIELQRKAIIDLRKKLDEEKEATEKVLLTLDSVRKENNKLKGVI